MKKKSKDCVCGKSIQKLVLLMPFVPNVIVFFNVSFHCYMYSHNYITVGSWRTTPMISNNIDSCDIRFLQFGIYIQFLLMLETKSNLLHIYFVLED